MTELNLPWVVIPLFFIVALLYSSVGHGGASGYLAVFTLVGITSPSIAPIALLLNVIVATTSFLNYRRAGHFSFALLLPFAAASIPLAYIGGFIPLSARVFSILLGSALLLAAVRTLLLREVKGKASAKNMANLWLMGVPVGGILGLISGMIGIGGGVFLSPVILLLGLADVKKTAAVSSAFIVFNSVSGLAGHLSRGNVAWDAAAILGITVLAGGFLGSYIGATRVRALRLQTLLGIVLVVASIKLLSLVFLQ